MLGSDYKLCEKSAQFDGKYLSYLIFPSYEWFFYLANKYAEVSRQQQQGQGKSVAQTTDDGAKGGKKKGQEEKPAKEAAAPKPEKKEKAKEQKEEEDETDEAYADEPKQKDPFAEMPKSSFNMDEFKRVYSNEDTATKALPYFWKNFDKENMSIWFCEYKYPEDLSQVFMTCNLVSGFFQRLEKLRKNAFASMCVFGENNNNTITGVWFWRGQDLAFLVTIQSMMILRITFFLCI